MTVKRMDNVGIVVESLETAIAFFAELGLSLEGRATVEGDWAGRITGLHPMRVEIAMMRTPDGHSRLELSRFLTPAPPAPLAAGGGQCILGGRPLPGARCDPSGIPSTSP